jgi:DNA replication protein DnaC
MLNDPTIEKMKALKLTTMIAAWQEQQRDPEIGSLSFDERLGLLMDAETLARENTRLARLLTDAKLRYATACLEDLDYAARRELDRSVIRQLMTCRWVQEHQAIVITGATGTGKSYLACALAQQACRKGHRALYRRASRLYEELTLARADGTWPRLLERLAKVEVLVLDDWGLGPLNAVARHDLLEVLEDRTGVRSTVITSQLPPSAWHDYIGDATTADAICDRVLHTAHRIALKGPSRRKPEPPRADEATT